MKRNVSIVCALVAVVALLFGAVPTPAAEDTTAKVSIESMSVAAGLGVSWGKGTLEYRGQIYPFTVNGFSLVDVGVSKLIAKGEVYNLTNVEDFEGTFVAAVAAGALGGGGGAAAMQNQKDVKMVWTATSQGVSFSLAHAGFNVKMTESDALQAAKRARRASVEAAPAALPAPSR
jgi:hypothetical protein